MQMIHKQSGSKICIFRDNTWQIKAKIHLVLGSLRACPNQPTEEQVLLVSTRKVCYLVNQINLLKTLEVTMHVVHFYMQYLGTFTLEAIQIGTTVT